MKQKLFSFIFLYSFTTVVAAQDFISRGKIEFEVKKSIKRMFKASNYNNNDYISSMPEFDITYTDLIFSWESSIYKPGRYVAPANANMRFFSPTNQNAVYTDLTKKTTVVQKSIVDESFIYADSIRPIKWQITNETRKIIGFECRKAIGRIYDSVYVVAFYAPEIIPQGGPEMFTGLPGMILGLAIPRYYTTWFATKLEVANIDESLIVPPTSKKIKQTPKKEIAEMLSKKYKDSFLKNQTVKQIEDNMLGGYVLY